MRFIKISDVEPGMILAAPVMDIDGRLLLNRNAKLNTYNIMRLNTFSHKGIYIYDELSEGIDVIETVSIDTRLEAIRATQDVNIDECMMLAGQIIEDVSQNEFIETNLTNLCMFDNDTYNHCVNVAAYCAMVGITLGYNEEKLKNLTMAALLHDIGKSTIPKEILNKPGKLTDEERSIINNHPHNGYLMLKDTDVSAFVKVGVYEHHENMDGSGYPRGLTGNKIQEISKIIHVCDVYDAMISRRSYKDKINPTDVIEYLYGGCVNMFDQNIVTAFVSRLMPYPKGITISLSTGQKAIVKENYVEHPLRPEIRLIDTREDIKLFEHHNITIIGFDDVA